MPDRRPHTHESALSFEVFAPGTLSLQKHARLEVLRATLRLLEGKTP